MGTASGATIGAEVQGLRRSLGEVCARLDPASVPLPEVCELWGAFDALERLAAGAKCRLASRVAQSRTWQDKGERSAADWMAHTSGTTTGRNRASLEASKALGALPATDAALAAGELSDQQAEAICAAAGAKGADPTDEARLLEIAAKREVRELREAAARVRARAEDQSERAKRLHGQRSLRTWTASDGSWNLFVRNTPEVGAELEAALAPLRESIFQAARLAARHEPAEAYGADALAELVRRSVGAEDAAAASARAARAGRGRSKSGADGQCPDAESGGPGANSKGGANSNADGKGSGAQGEGPEADRKGAGPEDRGADSDGGDAHAGGGNADQGAGPDSEGGDPHAGGGDADQSAGPDYEGADAAGPDYEGADAAGDDAAGDDAAGDDAAGDDQRHGATGADAERAERGGAERRGAESGDGGAGGGGGGRTGGDSRDARLDGSGGAPAETTTAEDTTGDPAAGSDTAAEAAQGHDTAGTHRSGNDTVGTDEMDHDQAVEATAPVSEDPRPPPWRSRRPDTKVIVLIDHEAMKRGRVEGDERCEIAGIGPVSVDTARSLMADCFGAAIVTDGTDVFTAVHLGRSVTELQRTALEARGYRCEVPGCGATRGLEIDHIEDWSRTFRTELALLGGSVVPTTWTRPIGAGA